MERRALICACLSSIAYDLKSTNEKKLKVLGLEAIEWAVVVNKNTQVLLVRTPDTIWCAWAGTDVRDLADILDDGDIRKRDEPKLGGKVHSGFYRHYRRGIIEVRDIILRWMAKHGRLKLVITGHSLGGAAATLMHKAWLSESECYVFGSPRVGDHKFAFNYGKELHRFSMLNDPVTSVPAFFRWSHVGPVNLMTPWGTLFKMPQKYRFWVTLRNLLFSFIQGRLINDIRESPVNHDIALYIARLHELRPGNRRLQESIGQLPH